MPGCLAGIFAQLRSALCDELNHCKYIETIHRKGYRMNADVVTLPLVEAEALLWDMTGGSVEYPLLSQAIPRKIPGKPQGLWPPPDRL